MRIHQLLSNYKYEILLFALIQHLYIGIFLTDLIAYSAAIWTINILILGIACVGVFKGKGKWKNIIKNCLFVLVLILPTGYSFFKHFPNYFAFLNLSYVFFFSLILWEILKFLIKPSYINKDIILGSICGYFLLIEILTFLLQYFFYQNPNCFKGVDGSIPAKTYTDLVYYSSITLTSIGFGDILPNSHYTKLITSFFGIAGQFYTVVLVGILLNKFSSQTNNN